MRSREPDAHSNRRLCFKILFEVWNTRGPHALLLTRSSQNTAHASGAALRSVGPGLPWSLKRVTYKALHPSASAPLLGVGKLGCEGSARSADNIISHESPGS